MLSTKGNKYRFSYRPTEQARGVHPYRMILYLFILASSMLFLVMIIALSVTERAFVTDEFSVPKPFVLGSFFILFSSFSLVPCLECYQREDLATLRKSLGVTLILASAFVVCQYLGWKEMLGQWSDLGSSRAATYLYILSGLHGVHYVVGLAGLVVIGLQWYRKRNDQVKNLIAITNPYELLKLQLLSVYWHFLGVVWVLVFLYFLFVIY